MVAFTACCQPLYSFSLCSDSIVGLNTRSTLRIAAISSISFQNPTANPAKKAARLRLWFLDLQAFQREHLINHFEIA